VKQLSAGFLDIGSKQKRISGLKNAANFGQKSDAGAAIKVPDSAAQKQYEQVLAGRAEYNSTYDISPPPPSPCQGGEKIGARCCVNVTIIARD